MEQDARAIAGQPIDPSTPLYKIPSFRLLFITRVASTTAFQMVGVIVGWHVYELTNSALHLGLIGLAQFIPQFFLMLPAGQVADRLNRRTVLWWCYGVAFLSAAGLMWVASQDRPTLAFIYALVALNMAARTFEQPVMQALLQVMAPRAVLNRAIAAHISARQAAVLIGPVLGGVLYYFGPVIDYGVCAGLTLVAAVCGFLLPNPGKPEKRMELNWELVAVGFRFIWRSETILGAMLFEFMASLFGSVKRAAADLCARHPRRRRLGRRPVAQRDRARRPAGGRRAHPHADQEQRRASGCSPRSRCSRSPPSRSASRPAWCSRSSR